MTGTAGIVSPTAPPDPLQWLICSSVSYRVRLPRSVPARRPHPGSRRSLVEQPGRLHRVHAGRKAFLQLGPVVRVRHRHGGPVAARAVAAGDKFQVLSILSEPYLLALLASFTGSFSTLQDLAGRLDMLRYGQQLYVSRQIEAFLEREAVAGLG